MHVKMLVELEGIFALWKQTKKCYKFFQQNTDHSQLAVFTEVS